MLELKSNSSQSDFKVLVYPISFYIDLKYEYELKPESSGITIVKDASGKKNIFDYNLVLIPIQKFDNWSLVVRILNFGFQLEIIFEIYKNI